MIVVSGALLVVALVLLALAVVGATGFAYASGAASLLALFVLLLAASRRRQHAADDVAGAGPRPAASRTPRPAASGHEALFARVPPSTAPPAPEAQPAPPAGTPVAVSAAAPVDLPIEDDDEVLEDEDREYGGLVLVVPLDGRYHVDGCPALQGRPTEVVDVLDAREEGRLPCGTCRPDAALAAALDDAELTGDLSDAEPAELADATPVRPTDISVPTGGAVPAASVAPLPTTRATPPVARVAKAVSEVSAVGASVGLRALRKGSAAAVARASAAVAARAAARDAAPQVTPPPAMLPPAPPAPPAPPPEPPPSVVVAPAPSSNGVADRAHTAPADGAAVEPAPPAVVVPEPSEPVGPPRDEGLRPATRRRSAPADGARSPLSPGPRVRRTEARSADGGRPADGARPPDGARLVQRRRVVVVPELRTFHRTGCELVLDVDGARELPRLVAASQGYRACLVCRP